MIFFTRVWRCSNDREIKYHLVDNNSITFTEETWADLHEKINHYFAGKKIIGWFMSQPGYGAVLNEVIYKTHSENFSETGKASND